MNSSLEDFSNHLQRIYLVDEHGREEIQQALLHLHRPLMRVVRQTTHNTHKAKKKKKVINPCSSSPLLDT